MAVGSQGLMCSLTELVFSSAACPHTLLSQASPGRCMGLAADTPDMEQAVLAYMAPDSRAREAWFDMLTVTKPCLYTL